MKKKTVCLLLVLCFLPACNSATPTFTPTSILAAGSTVTPSALPAPTLIETATPVATPTSLATVTPLANYPPEGYGTQQFPADVDPLTGLTVADPALLDRRPMAIKISNAPRSIRPQWGLNLADLVFDYYTEAGESRFIALFYGQDASMVGPIRSGRFFDSNVVRGYKAIFAFGGAYQPELASFENSDFRLAWSRKALAPR